MSCMYCDSQLQLWRTSLEAHSPETAGTGRKRWRDAPKVTPPVARKQTPPRLLMAKLRHSAVGTPCLIFCRQSPGQPSVPVASNKSRWTNFVKDKTNSVGKKKIKKKKPHNFFAYPLFLEKQRGAGNSSPTIFTDKSPKELFRKTYLNKKRQGLPATTRADLHFCMDVVGCGWCLAEAYHTHSKNNDLQWARSAHSDTDFILKQWHDIQNWPRNSLANLWCWRTQRSHSSRTWSKWLLPTEKPVWSPRLGEAEGWRLLSGFVCLFVSNFVPQIIPLILFLCLLPSLGFMVMSETFPLWGLVMTSKCFPPSPWSLDKLKPLLFLTGCPELWRPLLCSAESSSLFTSVMFPL